MPEQLISPEVWMVELEAGDYEQMKKTVRAIQYNAIEVCADRVFDIVGDPPKKRDQKLAKLLSEHILAILPEE